MVLSSHRSWKLIRQVLGAIAEYEKAMIVLRLKVARERIKRKGTKYEGQKNLKEVNAELLTRIKLLRRPHKDGKKMKLKDIALSLNEEGYRTKQGRPWTLHIVAVVLNRF